MPNPPIPKEIVDLRGGTARTHRPEPPSIVPGGRPVRVPEPPRGSAPDVKRAWRRIAPVLHDYGVLAEGDLPLFGQLCALYAECETLEKLQRSKGFTVTTANGELREAPWVKTLDRKRLALTRMAENFALTPVARTRLGLAVLMGRRIREGSGVGVGGERPPTAGTPQVRHVVPTDGDYVLELPVLDEEGDDDDGAGE